MLRIMIEAESSVVSAALESVIEAEEDLVRVSSARDADVVLWAADRARLHDGLSSWEEVGLDGYSPRAAIIVLLDRVETGAVRDALTSGASAVLTLDADAVELIAAIRAVSVGLSVLPSAASAELMRHLRLAPAPVDGGSASAQLTPRESEVLALLAGGLANKVIAARLGITEHTVKTHIASVYEKLQVGNRAEAVVAAARQGLLML